MKIKNDFICDRRMFTWLEGCNFYFFANQIQWCSNRVKNPKKLIRWNINQYDEIKFKRKKLDKNINFLPKESVNNSIYWNEYRTLWMKMEFVRSVSILVTEYSKSSFRFRRQLVHCVPFRDKLKVVHFTTRDKQKIRFDERKNRIQNKTIKKCFRLPFSFCRNFSWHQMRIRNVYSQENPLHAVLCVYACHTAATATATAQTPQTAVNERLAVKIQFVSFVSSVPFCAIVFLSCLKQ